MTGTTNWSTYQSNLFADFEDDTGNTVVIARAGCGKTTTAVEGINHIPKGRDTLFCAFNRSIADELKHRAPRWCDVRTLHGQGRMIMANAFGRDIVIDGDKGRDYCAQVLEERGHTFINRRREEQAYGVAKLAKLVSLAKNMLVPMEEPEKLMDLAIDWELDDDVRLSAPKLAAMAGDVLERCAEDTTRIDFDDMIWGPHVHNLRPASYDVVVVDETQDLNLAQLRLVQSLVTRTGRVVAIGDDRQAIYAFRGADSEAIPRMIKELEAKTLPLTITYRCPKRVVEIARQIVPDYEAAPTAPEGTVRYESPIALDNLGARPGDFVLSRANAPLVSTCLKYLAANVPACIAGRDIGKSLVELISKAKTDDVILMRRWIDRWKEKEISRFEDMEKAKKVEEIKDRAAAVEALSEGEPTVASVLEKIGRLFRDDDAKARVVFSSVHKAKGLERKRVWLIASTFTPDSVREEERNIYYVAVTRAQQELVFAGDVRCEGSR